MEKIFHIETNLPCIFSINNEKSSAMHQFSIATDEKEFAVLCTPLHHTQQYSPIILCVKLINDKVLCTNPAASIHKINANNYKIDLLFPICLIYVPQKLIYSTEINANLFVFFDGTIQKLVIKQKNQTKTILINEKLNNIEIKPFENFYALCAKRFNEEYLQVFNEQADSLFEGWSTKIEIKNNEIIVLKEIKDIAKHGFVTKYTLQNNKIVKTESYSVYLEEKPLLPTSQQSIGLAFIEAININNLKLARKFLCDELNNILTDKQLVEYFGNYESFEPNFLQNANNSLIFYYENDFSKIFNFEIKNSKITDITTD